MQQLPSAYLPHAFVDETADHMDSLFVDVRECVLTVRTEIDQAVRWIRFMNGLLAEDDLDRECEWRSSDGEANVVAYRVQIEAAVHSTAFPGQWTVVGPIGQNESDGFITAPIRAVAPADLSSETGQFLGKGEIRESTAMNNDHLPWPTWRHRTHNRCISRVRSSLD